jgi:hypothetical protein
MFAIVFASPDSYIDGFLRYHRINVAGYMIKHFILFSLILILVSCYHENKPDVVKPDRFLTKDEMIDILTDIQLSEAIMTNHLQNHAQQEETYKDSLFQVVFDQYDITSRQLRENINYYNLKPKEMEDIYEEVLTNLSKKQSEIRIKAEEIQAAKKAEEEKEKEEGIVNDSLP